ncbi:MAG: alpha-N-acetylglucosaminidase TIM-barrel domain-containing protein [Verrucomicrobiae bacterium]|nr:alpha-N-acetylglucosaminidase TIM-barrel domain-containing protein [Verrucomicrobiae bacterium]
MVSKASSILTMIVMMASFSSHAQTLLVQHGKPVAVIVLGAKNGPIERHAAGELAGYIEKISGAKLEIKSEGDAVAENARNVILLGQFETGNQIRKFCERKLLALTPEHPDSDGFVVKTLASDGVHYLVIGGFNERGTLYGVYHFLEECLDVGFFWDGEHVPKRDEIILKDVDLIEAPRFKLRQHLQECPFIYSTPCWRWGDWKHEIDWAVKKRFNAMKTPDKSSHTCLLVSPKNITEYIKKVGMKPVFWGGNKRFDWANDKKIREKHPATKYLELWWWSEGPYYFIHPKDPLFAELGRQAVRDIVKTHGPGNLYCVPPYDEMNARNLSPEELKSYRADFAQAMGACVKAEDPQGRWVFWTWPFLHPWTNEEVKTFVTALPSDGACIFDADTGRIPSYKRYDYFWGKNWGVSVLHAFGSDEALKGDLADLIKRIKQVGCDPRARHCSGFYLDPEIIRYNILYFELAARLGWDPEKVDLNEFLRSYALRRYGRESLPNMLKCLQGLRDSVYSANGGSEGMYQYRLPAKEDSGCRATLVDLAGKRETFPLLVEGLEAALMEKDRQRNNSLYERDLVDLARQCLKELFNDRMLMLEAAFLRGESDRFKDQAQMLDLLLVKLEDILSRFPLYQIAPMIERTKNIPGAEKRIRNNMFTLGGPLRDYAAKDMYELVKFYYHPRVNAYIQRLMEKLSSRNLALSSDQSVSMLGFCLSNGKNEMDSLYQKIEDDWVKKPFQDNFLVPEKERFNGSVVEAVEQALAFIKKNIKAMPAPSFPGASSKGGTLVGWKADFSSVSGWRMGSHKGGTLTTEGGKGILKADKGYQAVIYGARVDVALAQYPMLGFRFRFREPTVLTAYHHIWVTWEDEKGTVFRHRLCGYRYGAVEESWVEAQIDLNKVLSIVAKPVKLKTVEIENSLLCTTEWEWIRLTP